VTQEDAEGDSKQGPLTPAAEGSTRPASPAARWLEQNAGYILVIAGIVFGALGFIAGDTPIAAIFAGFGAGMIILGCFSSRISGDLVATRDGVRAAISEIERVASENRVPPEARMEIVGAALSLDWETPSRSRGSGDADLRQAARAAAQEAVPGVLRGWAHLAQIRDSFSTWLGEQGWNIEIEEGDGIVAQKANETLVADFNVSTAELRGERKQPPITAELLIATREFADRLRLRSNPRVAVVFSATRGVSRSALEESSRSNVELYSVDPHGEVMPWRRVDPRGNEPDAS